MIFQWPLYFLFLDNNDVKSFFKYSGNKKIPIVGSFLDKQVKADLQKEWFRLKFSREGIFRGFWRIAAFGWISNRTISSLILFRLIRWVTPALIWYWFWENIRANKIKWLGVPFKIKPKTAIRRNPRDNSFLPQF